MLQLRVEAQQALLHAQVFHLPALHEQVVQITGQLPRIVHGQVGGGQLGTDSIDSPQPSLFPDDGSILSCIRCGGGSVHYAKDPVAGVRCLLGQLVIDCR